MGSLETTFNGLNIGLNRGRDAIFDPFGNDKHAVFVLFAI